MGSFLRLWDAFHVDLIPELLEGPLAIYGTKNMKCLV